MSMRSFEAAILNEARQLIGKASLRQKDLQEWSSGEIKPREDERIFRLPLQGVWVSIKKTDLPKRLQSEAEVKP